MIINEKGNSNLNKSQVKNSTLVQTTASSCDVLSSKIKKRKIIILGKMGVGK
jgi:hypothetical protein